MFIMYGGHNVVAIRQVAAPAPPMVVATSAVWEVIERRKREKVDLEEAVARKEDVAAVSAFRPAAEEVKHW